MFNAVAIYLVDVLSGLQWRLEKGHELMKRKNPQAFPSNQLAAKDFKRSHTSKKPENSESEKIRSILNVYTPQYTKYTLNTYIRRH